MEILKGRTKPTIERQLALKDAIELLSGKWKIVILKSLYLHGTMRFKDVMETSAGITPKVLSKELQQLEENLLITRTVNNTKPVSVSYALTDHAGKTLPVINALIEFGLIHRKKIKSQLP
ncbi:helix-turn-helix transcriptional regulator [Mucilaginibacter sp. Bleaf8]|uniref:winged helix-turn-helix transcriptional regulator n=1 Tax=Mucilaginibacter sp. Bleaf8 TaxID=2834430 RepID=UPI001BCFD0BE|nr:helix-turn-helix domain-containing protein [Mucilaginibacter sp. Bleaf8]MBS7565461.1 helix-turn-helix transcriptional regulator [Mucilaginibacter sp. Bleaf8]